MRWWILAAGLVATGAVAQHPDLPDAGLPDASLGETGAERSSEEEDDALDVPCLSDRDCDQGFTCTNGRCTWQRYREATQLGCASAPGLSLLALALAARGYFLVKRTK